MPEELRHALGTPTLTPLARIPTHPLLRALRLHPNRATSRRGEEGSEGVQERLWSAKGVMEPRRREGRKVERRCGRRKVVRRRMARRVRRKVGREGREGILGGLLASPARTGRTGDGPVREEWLLLLRKRMERAGSRSWSPGERGWKAQMGMERSESWEG